MDRTGRGDVICTLALLLAIALVSGVAQCAEPSNRENFPYRTWRDDAALHDVCVMGQNIWAVGDQGVIWHSPDDGQTWQTQESYQACPLRTICFLTDRVGFIAGGNITPFTRLETGVLLKTTDGGQTWHNFRFGSKADPNPQLSIPVILKLKFFSPEVGYALTTPDKNTSATLFKTENGGSDWRAIPAQVSGAWRCADFVGPDLGALAGKRGATAMFVTAKVVPARNGPQGLRGSYGMALDASGSGWLVGDGGSIQKTDNLGLVWTDPPGQFPESARRSSDFSDVCVRGEKVWICGSPGSAIWHSPDGGRTWLKQSTGDAAPLTSIAFSDDKHGCAAGAFGRIVVTSDGGRTWSTARGAGRRAAYLHLALTSSGLTLAPEIKLSGESGYRGVLKVLCRDDLPPVSAGEIDSQLATATAASGAQVSREEWALPLVIPDIGTDRDALIEEWSRVAESRLDELLVRRLVSDLRTWKPSVVVLDGTGEPDALQTTVREAVVAAVKRAADPLEFIEQRECGLDPWHVERIIERLPNKSTGAISIDPFHALAQRGTVWQESQRLESLVATGGTPATAAAPVSFQIVSPADDAARDFFVGLSIAPGSAARRELPENVAPAASAETQRVARELRSLNAVASRISGEGPEATQFVGQLRSISRRLPRDAAAQELWDIAERQFQAGHWAMMEMTLVELVDAYPDEDVAQRAAVRLIQLWTSTEMMWRRIRASTITGQNVSMRPTEGAEMAVAEAMRKLEEDRQLVQEIGFTQAATSSLPPDAARRKSAPSLQSEKGSLRPWVDEKFQFWLEQARKLDKDLTRRNPRLLDDPLVAFANASRWRRSAAPAEADAIFRRFMADEGNPWFNTASAEAWLLRPTGPPQKSVVLCRFTSERPHLDGDLTDACWRVSPRVYLTSRPTESPAEDPSATVVRVAYDEKFFYLAAKVPREKATLAETLKPGDRRHDEDLSRHDRLAWWLDVDRDTATAYQFEVDQRGRTAESCWGDTTWNPKWFVATATTPAGWSLEMAIPWDELVPQAPEQRTAFYIGGVRTIPGTGVHSLTHPASSVARPEDYGVLVFE